jgi:hypothetical protein
MHVKCLVLLAYNYNLNVATKFSEFPSVTFEVTLFIASPVSICGHTNLA